jgi:hypothetical protein
MALFMSKGDVGLSSITQLCQLTDAEVGAFIKKTSASEFPEIWDQGPTWEELLNDALLLIEARDNLFRRYPPALLEAFFKLSPEDPHRDLVGDTLYATAPGSKDETNQLLNFIRGRFPCSNMDTNHLSFEAIQLFHGATTDLLHLRNAASHMTAALADDYAVPQESINVINTLTDFYTAIGRLVWNEEEKRLERKIAEKIQINWSPVTCTLLECLGDIVEAVSNKSSFRRCNECHHPYLVRNDNQEFCSHRCRHRVAARRDYDRRFSEYRNFRSLPKGQRTR